MLWMAIGRRKINFIFVGIFIVRFWIYIYGNIMEETLKYNEGGKYLLSPFFIDLAHRWQDGELCTEAMKKPPILLRISGCFRAICNFQISFTGAHITFKSSSSTQPESWLSWSRAFRSRFRLCITMAASSSVYATMYFCLFIRQPSFVLLFYMEKGVAANMPVLIAMYKRAINALYVALYSIWAICSSYS